MLARTAEESLQCVIITVLKRNPWARCNGVARPEGSFVQAEVSCSLQNREQLTRPLQVQCAWGGGGEKRKKRKQREENNLTV